MEREYIRDKRSPIPKNSTVSKVMSSIKGKNTKLELLFRNALYNAGARGYRINHGSLPGKPDIVFTKKKIIVFIHGCFWHGCKICGGRVPNHNNAYWANKLRKNIDRDIRRKLELEEKGYSVVEVWEHEIKRGLDNSVKKVMKLLKNQKHSRYQLKR